MASRCLDRGECRHLAKTLNLYSLISVLQAGLDVLKLNSRLVNQVFAGVSRRNKRPWMQTPSTLTASLVAIFSGRLFGRTPVQTRCLCLGPLLALPSHICRCFCRCFQGRWYWPFRESIFCIQKGDEENLHGKCDEMDR